METRTITQVKVYTLHLNSMYGRFENTKIAAISYNRKDLQNWYESQKVEKYVDGGYRKTFQKGSTLEYFNPIEFSDYGGISEDWAIMQDIEDYVSRNHDCCTLVPESNINQ